MCYGKEFGIYSEYNGKLLKPFEQDREVNWFIISKDPSSCCVLSRQKRSKSRSRGISREAPAVVRGGLDQNAREGEGDDSQVSPRMGQAHWGHHTAFAWLLLKPGKPFPKNILWLTSIPLFMSLFKYRPSQRPSLTILAKTINCPTLMYYSL